jgi:ribosome-interacting GTPase 1
MDLLLNELTKADIRINQPAPPLTIEKTGANKIQVLYLTKQAKGTDDLDKLTEEIKEIVTENGIRNGIVKVYGKITIDDLLDVLIPSVVYKKVILIGTKGDLPHTQETFEILKRENSNRFPIILGTSIHKENFPKDFGEIILKVLKKIRIFTMSNGIVANQPLLMDEGVTVNQVAEKIHRSFYENFDHAIVIREGARQKRKKVGSDYKLEDYDIIEIHMA